MCNSPSDAPENSSGSAQVLEPNTQQDLSAVVTADPFASPTFGTAITFRHTPFSSWNASSGLNSVRNWDFFEGAVISVHIGTDENFQILGSGSIVAPGVAVVAKHVVEPHSEPLLNGEIKIFCSGITSSRLVMWAVRQVTFVNDSDIAFLILRLASESPGEFRQAPISTHMPRVGSRLLIAGIRQNIDRGATASNSFHAELMIGVGTVTQVYPTGRDSVMLPWPAIEIDCDAIGGMSGGPAFDENGFQVGILTSSVEGDHGGPAYVTLLWTALAHRITPCWPETFYQAPISLLEMDRRICGIERPEVITVNRNEENNRINQTYEMWHRE